MCPVSLSLTCNWRAWKAPVALRHRCPCTCPGGRTINIDFYFEIMFLLKRASYLCCFSFSTINTRAAGRFPPRAVFPGSSRSLFPLPFRYRMPWRQQRLVLSFKSWNNAISPVAVWWIMWCYTYTHWTNVQDTEIQPELVNVTRNSQQQWHF